MFGFLLALLSQGGQTIKLYTNPGQRLNLFGPGVALRASQCTCVALMCPSVQGHTGTMSVMFIPQGSQIGSTNSCFHEA